VHPPLRTRLRELGRGQRQQEAPPPIAHSSRIQSLEDLSRARPPRQPAPAKARKNVSPPESSQPGRRAAVRAPGVSCGWGSRRACVCRGRGQPKATPATRVGAERNCGRREEDWRRKKGGLLPTRESLSECLVGLILPWSMGVKKWP